jgi:hypothetical protein
MLLSRRVWTLKDTVRVGAICRNIRCEFLPLVANLTTDEEEAASVAKKEDPAIRLPRLERFLKAFNNDSDINLFRNCAWKVKIPVHLHKKGPDMELGGLILVARRFDSDSVAFCHKGFDTADRERVVLNFVVGAYARARCGRGWASTRV